MLEECNVSKQIKKMENVAGVTIDKRVGESRFCVASLCGETWITNRMMHSTMLLKCEA